MSSQKDLHHDSRRHSRCSARLCPSREKQRGTPAASLHRFDAYRLALAFRAHVVRWLPLKRAELSDQLDRASISAVLNLAEGAGRVGRDQARHYAMSRGSAFECLAVLDLLDLETAPTGSPQARIVLLRLMAILTALVRR